MEEFFERLQKTPNHSRHFSLREKLMVLSDLNGQVGADRHSKKEGIGTFGIGNKFRQSKDN